MEIQVTNDNMWIYEQVRAVPDNAQKPFDNGKFRGTDISPMWRIKKLTEMFGAAGIGWYTEIINRETLVLDDDVFAIVDINLYIKVNDEWSKPIFGTGGNKLKMQTRNGKSTSDEGFKMAYTDALSVACKALGIGADVYFAADKSSKYLEDYAPAPPQPIELITPEQVQKIQSYCTPEQIQQILNQHGMPTLTIMPAETAQKIITKLEARRSEITNGNYNA